MKLEGFDDLPGRFDVDRRNFFWRVVVPFLPALRVALRLHQLQITAIARAVGLGRLLLARLIAQIAVAIMPPTLLVITVASSVRKALGLLGFGRIDQVKGAGVALVVTIVERFVGLLAATTAVAVVLVVPLRGRWKVCYFPNPVGFSKRRVRNVSEPLWFLRRTPARGVRAELWCRETGHGYLLTIKRSGK